MAHSSEPMDVDISAFDDKENAFQHNNVPPITDRGHEDLDASEMSMKLRYSLSPVASPMSRSYHPDVTKDTLNNTIVVENSNLTRSLNITASKNDTILKVPTTLPLQTIHMDHVEGKSILNSLDVSHDHNTDSDDTMSLLSSSSSVSEATTPVREPPKPTGSPIMRGLKSVLSMFRPSQSPTASTEHGELNQEDIPSIDNENISPASSGPAVASTPQSLNIKHQEDAKKCALKENLVFNDDLERELQWKEDTTIIFSKEKIPIQKLFYQELKATDSQRGKDVMLPCVENLNASVEPMDVSYNKSVQHNKTFDINNSVSKNTTIDHEDENESIFLDCETTFNEKETDLESKEHTFKPTSRNSDIHEQINTSILSEEPHIGVPVIIQNENVKIQQDMVIQVTDIIKQKEINVENIELSGESNVELNQSESTENKEQQIDIQISMKEDRVEEKSKYDPEIKENDLLKQVNPIHENNNQSEDLTTEDKKQIPKLTNIATLNSNSDSDKTICSHDGIEDLKQQLSVHAIETEALQHECSVQNSLNSDFVGSNVLENKHLEELKPTSNVSPIAQNVSPMVEGTDGVDVNTNDSNKSLSELVTADINKSFAEKATISKIESDTNTETAQNETTVIDSVQTDTTEDLTTLATDKTDDLSFNILQSCETGSANDQKSCESVSFECTNYNAVNVFENTDLMSNMKHTPEKTSTADVFSTVTKMDETVCEPDLIEGTDLPININTPSSFRNYEDGDKLDNKTDEKCNVTISFDACMAHNICDTESDLIEDTKMETNDGLASNTVDVYHNICDIDSDFGDDTKLNTNDDVASNTVGLAHNVCDIKSDLIEDTIMNTNDDVVPDAVDEEVLASESNSPFVSLNAESTIAPLENEPVSLTELDEHTKSQAKVDTSPPISPKPGCYNFNFDDIDDPFATKTKIRVTPVRSFDETFDAETSDDKSINHNASLVISCSDVNVKQNDFDKNKEENETIISKNKLDHNELVNEIEEVVNNDCEEDAAQQGTESNEPVVFEAKNRSTSDMDCNLNVSNTTSNLPGPVKHDINLSGNKSMLRLSQSPDFDVVNPFASKCSIRQSPDHSIEPDRDAEHLKEKCKIPLPVACSDVDLQKNELEKIKGENETVSSNEKSDVSENVNKIEGVVNNDYEKDAPQKITDPNRTVIFEATSSTKLSNSDVDKNITINISKTISSLPESKEDDINPFENKSKLRLSPSPDFDIVDPFASRCRIRQSPDQSIKLDSDAERVDETKIIESNKQQDDPCFDNANTSHDNDDTLCEGTSEDEDTLVEPFIEQEKEDIYDVQNFEINQFTELAQESEENCEAGEMFIDADAFDFLMNQNQTLEADGAKESLFLKFDPLFTQRMNSDGVVDALSKLQRRQSTPKKLKKFELSKLPKSPAAGPSNRLHEAPNTSEPQDEAVAETNTTVNQKPTMIVPPARNPEQTPRKPANTSTPPRANRISSLFTSPAMAAIDRLLSISANNSPAHSNESTQTNASQNEANTALVQLREALTEKENYVQQLRSENNELRDRLDEMESQVTLLEAETEKRRQNVDEMTEKLAEKESVNKIMSELVEGYERTIAGLMTGLEKMKMQHAEEREQLMRERDEQSSHLANMEVTFNDLHSKYEKSKQIIFTYKSQQDEIQKSVVEAEEKMLKMQNIYEQLKQHATSKLNAANQELEQINKAHETEVVKMNAIMKRKDMTISSLEETLAQKTKANEELTAICDELISKVG